MQGLVTVFGGSGFIGAQVVRALAKRGYRVRIAVRRPNVSYRMRVLGEVGQIELVQANLRNGPSVARATEGPLRRLAWTSSIWPTSPSTRMR